MTLADVLPDEDGQARADGEIVGHTVGVDQRRRQDGVEAVHVEVLARERLQLGVAEGADLDQLESEGDRAVSRLERRSRDGGDGPGSSRGGDAGGMMRKGRRREDDGGQGRDKGGLAMHECSPR